MFKKIYTQPKFWFLTIFLFLLLFLPWKGFYFLNDDYIYYWSALNFKLHPLVSPTLIFQTVLGKLVLYFSKEPEFLRLLTIFLSFWGVLGLYKILVFSHENSKFKSFIFSLLLLFNPLYLYLSFSFMSDIYYLSNYIIGLFFIFMFLKKQEIKFLFFATLFFIFAFLSRQMALFSVLPIFIYLYIFFSKHRKLILTNFFAFLFVFIWYQFFYDKPLGYTERSVALTISSIGGTEIYKMAFERLFKTFYYIGFFVFPVSLSLFFFDIFTLKFLKQKKEFGILLLFLALFSAISAYFWFLEVQIMFYLPNILTYAGFNPQSIGDGMKQTIFVDSPFRIGVLITLISLLSVSVLFSKLVFLKWKELFKNQFFIILLISTFCSYLPTLIFRDFYDRYLIILLPLILYTCTFFQISTSRLLKFSFIVLTIIFILISLIFEHDYLQLNKKVWEVTYKSSRYHMLTPQNTHSTYEYNKYFFLDISSRLTDSKSLFGKDWFPKRLSKKYIISYTDTWDYCRLERIYYPSFIYKESRTQGYFELLQKGNIPFDPTECVSISKEFDIKK